jgi:hypothetical protein
VGVGQGAVGSRGRPAWADSPLAVRAAPTSGLLVYERWMALGGDWVRKEVWTYHQQERSGVCTVAAAFKVPQKGDDSRFIILGIPRTFQVAAVLACVRAHSG